MFLLSEARAGQRCTVKWTGARGEEKNILENIGIAQGSELEIISSYFGNLIVSVDGKRIAVNKEVADLIKV